MHILGRKYQGDQGRWDHGWVSVLMPSECRGHVDYCGQHPVLGGAAAIPAASPLLTSPWPLFQCPRVNGVKAHTSKHNRRQVVLDLQIW